MQNIPDELRAKLVEDLGIASLSPEEQENAIERSGKIVLQNIMAKALDRLSEDEQDLLDKITSASGEDQSPAMEFLAAHVPGWSDLVRDETEAFKAEARAVMEAAEGKEEEG